MLDVFNSIGQVKSVYTLVDFYQYIKTVEYLICIAFFVGFPMFYQYLMGGKGSSQDTAH
jgi:hypothetical protein